MQSQCMDWMRRIILFFKASQRTSLLSGQKEHREEKGKGEDATVREDGYSQEGDSGQCVVNDAKQNTLAPIPIPIPTHISTQSEPSPLPLNTLSAFTAPGVCKCSASHNASDQSPVWRSLDSYKAAGMI